MSSEPLPFPSQSLWKRHMTHGAAPPLPQSWVYQWHCHWNHGANYFPNYPFSPVDVSDHPHLSGPNRLTGCHGTTHLVAVGSTNSREGDRGLFLGEECCFYVSLSGIVKDRIHNSRQISENKRNRLMPLPSGSLTDQCRIGYHLP